MNDLFTLSSFSNPSVRYFFHLLMVGDLEGFRLGGTKLVDRWGN